MRPESAFDFRVEASLENLHEIRAFIDQSGTKLGIGKSALADLCLVVDEAVTNIVLHGYQGRGGDVSIHIAAQGDDAVVRIRDQARYFDAQDVSAPQLDTQLANRPFGGMGLFLIRKMTDKTEFRSMPEGGNELELVKKGVIQRR